MCLAEKGWSSVNHCQAYEGGTNLSKNEKENECSASRISTGIINTYYYINQDYMFALKAKLRLAMFCFSVQGAILPPGGMKARKPLRYTNLGTHIRESL